MSVAITRAWTWTNDPADPCAYCVVWDVGPGDPNEDEGRPVWPDGSTVPRIYKHIHRRCEESVIAYISEREHE